MNRDLMFILVSSFILVISPAAGAKEKHDPKAKARPAVMTRGIQHRAEAPSQANFDQDHHTLAKTGDEDGSSSLPEFDGIEELHHPDKLSLPDGALYTTSDECG